MGKAFLWRCTGEGGFLQDLGICLVAPDVPWPHSRRVRYQAAARPLAGKSCKAMPLRKWRCMGAPEPAAGGAGMKHLRGKKPNEIKLKRLYLALTQKVLFKRPFVIRGLAES